MKQFGFDFEETLAFADTNSNYAAIVAADVPTSSLAAIDGLDISQTIDPWFFKSGVLTVHEDQLATFNDIVTVIRQAL
jgi:hypothetical protein